MKINRLYPKEVCADIEFTNLEIEKLIRYMDHCMVEYNSDKSPEMKAADEFVKEQFYPNIVEIYKAMREI